MRMDQLLVERGLAASRSQAQRLIAAGVQWRQSDGSWRAVVKNRDEVPIDAALQLLDDAESRYVSRGGLKLEGALKATGIPVMGLRCLDVGQSTGGFTDCLLQQGAAQVVGIDVGHAQVHPRIREDERVVCIEGVNARELEPGDERIPSALEGFDLLVGDVSFISLTLVLPGVVHLLKPAGVLLMLVKPQFELQPGQVGKGGIVKDDSHYPFIENRVRTALSDLGLRVNAWLNSPIEGGDGNREFFVQASWPDPAAVLPAREASRLAHEADLAAKADAEANDH
jgi:23S rRNA (cytidine1920-2'-O)/16S rRNA (cytidine1409-2'-O)-methyltransferase